MLVVALVRVLILMCPPPNKKKIIMSIADSRILSAFVVLSILRQTTIEGLSHKVLLGARGKQRCKHKAVYPMFMWIRHIYVQRVGV